MAAGGPQRPVSLGALPRQARGEDEEPRPVPQVVAGVAVGQHVCPADGAPQHVDPTHAGAGVRERPGNVDVPLAANGRVGYEKRELQAQVATGHARPHDLEAGFQKQGLGYVGHLLAGRRGPVQDVVGGPLPFAGGTVHRVEQAALGDRGAGQVAASPRLRADLVQPSTFVVEALLGKRHVAGVQVVPDSPAPGPEGGHKRAAGTQERVQHQVVAIGVEVDQPSGELHGEGSRVAHPGGLFGVYAPHVEGGLHELVGGDGALRRQAVALALCRRASPVEATLAGDNHPLGHVPQHRVGGPPEGPPGHRSGGALGLLPDHLPPQQQAQFVLEDPDDVGRQAAVRLAAQVRHVDGDPPSGLHDPHALGEHVAEHLEVLEVRRGHAVAFHLQLVVLAHEVGRRGDDEGHRRVRQLVHVPGVAVQATVAQVGGTDDRVVVGQSGGCKPGVEGRGVVVLTSTDAERSGGGRAAPLFHLVTPGPPRHPG